MASPNISLRVSDDERKSLDERAKLAGKDNRSEFILSQINLFDEDEYAWLCDQAKEQLVSVEDFIRFLVRAGKQYLESAAPQEQLMKLEVERLRLKSAVDRSEYTMLVQLVSMVNNLVSVEVASSSREIALAKTKEKFEQLDVVESVMAKIAPGAEGAGEAGHAE